MVFSAYDERSSASKTDQHQTGHRAPFDVDPEDLPGKFSSLLNSIGIEGIKDKAGVK